MQFAEANAELLNFFAQCSDGEESNRSPEKSYKKHKSIDQQHRTSGDINLKKRMSYATNTGVSSFLTRESSYKILTEAIGKDANGNKVGASLNEFKIQRNIGTGAYAIVRLATHEATRKRVALKIYSTLNLEKMKRKSIWQESQCLKILNSQYFPKLYADFEQESENLIVLVQEYVSGQSLYQVIKNKGQKAGLAEDNCKFFFR